MSKFGEQVVDELGNAMEELAKLNPEGLVEFLESPEFQSLVSNSQS